jgi:hypothetical protein
MRFAIHTACLAGIVFLAPAWAERRVVDTTKAERTARPKAGRRARAASHSATAPAMAPGVIQMNMQDASHIVWFVATQRIPAGATLMPFLLFPDGFEIDLDTLTMNQDVQPGESFDLPNIRRFGPFWPQGPLTYGMAVTVNGNETQVTADYPVDSARDYNDLTDVVPLITTYAESISNRDVQLSIRGVFTTDLTYVLLDDIVVPASAIRVTASEITVNLSKVTGFDLTVAQERLLTVGQSGWCDTVVFRHTPARPGTYNSAQ